MSIVLVASSYEINSLEFQLQISQKSQSRDFTFTANSIISISVHFTVQRTTVGIYPKLIIKIILKIFKNGV